MDWGLGVAFQYLRSMKNTPELVRVLIFLGAACLMFFASPEGRAATDAQSFAAGVWVVIQHALVATSIVSVTSNVSVMAGVPQVHPLVPITNSN